MNHILCRKGGEADVARRLNSECTKIFGGFSKIGETQIIQFTIYNIY